MTGCTHGLLVDIARFTLLREDLYVWYSPFNPGELLISCWRMNALRSLKTVNYGIRLNSNYRGARARTSSHGFDLLFHRLFDPHQKGSQQNTTWRIDCVHIDWCGFTLFIHNQHGCLNSNDKMCQTKLCTKLMCRAEGWESVQLFGACTIVHSRDKLAQVPLITEMKNEESFKEWYIFLCENPRKVPMWTQLLKPIAVSVL